MQCSYILSLIKNNRQQPATFSDRGSIFIAWLIITLILVTNLWAIDAQDYYQRGNNYANVNRYPEAIEEYNKALRLNPYYKEAYNKLGVAYLSQKLPQKAQNCINKAITLDPNYIEAYNNLGQVYEFLDKLTKAEDIYRRIFKINPVDVPAHFNLARVLNKQGKFNASIAEYEKTIKINPKHFPSYIGLGDVYFKSLHKPDQAIFYYQKAKKINPLDETPYLKQADLYKEEGLLDRAREEYQSALKLNSSNIEALTQLAYLCLKDKEYKKTLYYYNKLSDLTPSDSLIHYDRGITYKRLGKYSEAINDFKKVLQLDPYNEMALFQLEKVLFLDKQEVSSPLRKEASHIHLELANNYYKNQLLSLARYEYQNSIKLNPQNFEAHSNLSMLYKKQGLLDSSIEELRRAIELEPNLNQAQERLTNLLWLNETTLINKERINFNTLPLPIDKIAINLYSKGSYHTELGLAATEMAISFLKQYPQFDVIETPYQEQVLKNLIPLARKEKAGFVLFGMVEEEDKQSFLIEAELIEIENLKTLTNITLPIKGNYKMAKDINLLAKRMIQAFPVKGRIIKIIDDDKVIINLGKTQGLRDNQILEIFSNQQTRIGQIKIMQSDQIISKARIITPRAINLVRINDYVQPVTKGIPTIKKSKIQKK